MYKRHVPPRKKRQFPNLGWVLFTVIILVFFIVVGALKSPISESFIKKGDEKLAEGKFVEAVVEYKKAEYLVKSKKIDEKLDLADRAQKDVLVIEDLIREKNDIEKLNLLAIAKSVPGSEYETVLVAKRMIESNEPMLALIAANTAIEMNRNYKDAWLYLGIAHLETSQKIQLTLENKDFHYFEAKTAFERAKQIDQNDELIDKYLDQIN